MVPFEANLGLLPVGDHYKGEAIFLDFLCTSLFETASYTEPGAHWLS